MKTLSHKMLARFTQVDYDREIAMVAIDDGGGAEKMIGVSQVFIHPDGKHGEFSILVGDPWHGQGVGANLLAHVLRIAKERGLTDVWGVVLRDNVNMLALGRKLGFDFAWSSDGSECRLNIDLEKIYVRADDNMLIQVGPAILLLTLYLLATYHSLDIFPPLDSGVIPELARPLFSL